MFLRWWLLLCLPLYGNISVGVSGVGADLLYWKPMLCPYTYAESVDGDLETSHEITADMEAGFRLWIENPCLKLSFSYLDASGKAEVTGPGLNVEAVAVAVARSSLRVRYQAADLRIFLAPFYILASWADINRNSRTRGFNGTAILPFDDNAEFAGGGVGFGAQMGYSLFCADLHISAIVGRQKIHRLTSSEAGNQINRITPYANTVVIPRIGLALMLHYRWLRIGYEGDIFIRALSIGKRSNASTVARVAHQIADTAGFAGPFLGLGVEF